MPSVLDDLPPDCIRHRLLDSKQASAFCGFNEEYWRRLHREKKTPPATRLSKRKLGWPVGVLIDWLAEAA